MREVKAVKINAADFAPYGTFCNMTEPEGYPLSGEIHKFYPDRISGTCTGSMAFSPIAVRKDDRIVKMAEYHTTTWEGIVALDDDMIIHVAPASGGTPVAELRLIRILPVCRPREVLRRESEWHCLRRFSLDSSIISTILPSPCNRSVSSTLSGETRPFRIRRYMFLPPRRITSLRSISSSLYCVVSLSTFRTRF